MIINNFKEGIIDGIPIGLGYLGVSFTFGMMAVSMGIPIEVATIISLTNLTSAGQFAALDIMLLQSAYIEMALTQMIINLRYALMSLSLSQKIDPTLSTTKRALMAFAITDEIYAIASNKQEKVGTHYFIGLALIPIIGWCGGTWIGASASQLLPITLRSVLEIAIYGMFLAIIIPPAKTNNHITKVIVLSAIISCIFYLLSTYISIGTGFVIILCTLVSAGCMAYFFPIEDTIYE